MKYKILLYLGNILKPILTRLMPTKWKEFNELLYWKSQSNNEGVLKNDHYEHFYTAHFGIEKSFYDGKVLMDVGCGPRGSLEWSKNAKRKIGLDPLANDYLKLGADKHSMEYISAPSEHIPLEDGTCDAVFSFNSLDHVEDINQSINEIKRCTKSGGLILLLVEVNHPPTSCEPHNVSPKFILDSFGPEFTAEQVKVYKITQQGMYACIKDGKTYEDPLNCMQKGYFSAKFTKNS
ncbi:MAG: class I SAM-dependent methyltransferase [Flavobacteriales bacterium]